MTNLFAKIMLIFAFGCDVDSSDLKYVYICWITKIESYSIVTLVTMLSSAIKIVIKFHLCNETNFVISKVDFHSKDVNICQ